MFSRYKKPAAPEAAAPKPAATGARQPAAPQASPSTAAVARRPMSAAAAGAPAQAAAADKERKRKERMGEMKVELHKRLLDNLNLGALEHASESELRQEIVAITTEALEEM